MSRLLNIFSIELNSKWGDKATNIREVENIITTKMPINTDIVVLPEMFSTGFVTNDKDVAVSLSEKNIDNTIRYLQEISKKFNVAIAGSFLARTNTKLYNRFFFIEPSGDDYYYDKYHLFSMGNESDIYSPGEKKPPIIRFRGWNIMPIVCYDLRFPCWCRNDSNKYDLLIVVANWPKVREYAWKHLLIARAIENQCYVCGVNRSGVDEYGYDYGESSSLIIDFKGKPIQQEITTIIQWASLNGESLDKFREKFPVWKDYDSFTLL